MRRTFQIDIPEPSGTSRGQLAPSLDTPLSYDTDVREETSREGEAGIASRLTSMVISGSSVSSRGSETSVADVGEPPVNCSNNSGLSFEHRTPKRKFKRPSSYILRYRREEGREQVKAPEQRGTKRFISDEDRSSSEDEGPNRHDDHMQFSAVLDRGAIPPWPAQRQLGGPWKRPPETNGRDHDVLQGPGICDAMQDEVLTPALNKRPEPFDWGPPSPNILQEITNHDNRQRNVEGCPEPVPWANNGRRYYWRGEQLKQCPNGSSCSTSDTSSSGSLTGLSYRSRFRYEHLIKR